MANQLMFEIGIKNAEAELKRIEEEIKTYAKKYENALHIKMKIDNLDTLTQALGQIGDSTALRNLRTEIAALNREFSILSKGAGGVGDMVSRGLAADIERTTQSIDRYTKKIQEITDARNRLPGGARNTNYQSMSDEILQYTTRLEGARKKLAELNEQKSKPVAEENLKKATQEAQSFEAALGRIETAISGLKSGMSVNMSGDFAKWAQEIQNVTTSVRELVEQLQKMNAAETKTAGGAQGGLFDPQKFTSLQDAIDKIISEINRLQQAFTKLGENNSLLFLDKTINSLAITLSNMSNAIKLQPLDEQVKRLIEENEQLKQKLIEVGEAARYINIRAGEKTQQKASNVMGITGVDEEKIERVSNLLERYRKLLADVQNHAANLGTTQNIAEKLGLNPALLDQAAKKFEILWKTIENSIRNGMGLDVTHKGLPVLDMSSDQLAKLRAEFSALLSEYKQITQQVNQFANSNLQLTASEQRLAAAMKQTTDSMRNQSQVLNDLKSLAYQYVSIWGAQSFINNIIETGGLLEQQRLSIAAILGDMEQANTLFGQIQQLALKSPFGVVELDRFSKQLTAYGFEYEELYDWTKRLGDISAATGTDVSRLALAIGHVRAEGALSGYTLRQFAMANVPVLRMLSENLGISTKEVREKVRKKDISYEDVKKILEELTNEGGMFYNAQEVMSQALNAKYKNLRDAFDIMYGQIAEGGVGDALKSLAETLTAMAKHWERVGKDILGVAAVFGIQRAAMYLTNSAVGANTLATLKNIKAVQLQENAHLRLARAAGLVTKAEYNALVSNGAYTASSLKVAIVENRLTIEELQRAVALGKVNKAIAAAAVTQAGYDAKLITSITVLKGWRKAAFLAGEGIRSMLRSIGSAIAALWPLLAFSAVFELFNRAGEQQEQAADAAENAAKATNSYHDIINLNERLKDSEGQKDEQLREGIKQMEEALESIGKYTEELKKQVEEVGTLAEKYDVLRAAMKGVADVGYDKQERKQALLNEAFNVGGGSKWNPINWFRDNALKDAKDIDDYATQLSLALDKNDRVLRKAFERDLKERGLWLDKYASQSAKDIFMSLDDKGRDELLESLRSGKSIFDKVGNAAKDVAEVLYGYGGGKLEKADPQSYVGALKELESHKEDVAKLVADAFNVDYPDIDLTKATNEQKVMFQKWLSETLANIDGLKDAGRRAFENIVIEGTIGIRVDYKIEDNLDDVLEGQKKKNPLLYGYIYKGGTGGLTAEGAKETWEENEKLFGDYSHSNVSAISKGISEKINANKKNIKANQALVDSSEASAESKKLAQEAIKKDEEENKKLMDYLEYTNQSYVPEKTKGGSEDKAAKALRERVRILKEAETSYQYWRKAVGEKASAAHVNAEFGETLSKQGYSFENIQQYKKTLQDLRDEYQKIYDVSKSGGKDRPQLLEAIKEIDKVLADIIRKDFEKASSDYLSTMKYKIEELTRQWEIFNSVVESTGDRALASRLTGIAPGATPADLKRANVQSYAGVSINFDKVLQMSDRQIDDYVASLGVAEDKIEAIRDGLKDWKKAQQDVAKSDIENYAKWLGSLVDLQSIRNRNQEEYNRILEETNRLLREGKITEQEAYNRQSAAMNARMSKDWEASNTYARLYDTSQMMARDEFNAAYAREMDNLNKKLTDGTITTAEYADKVEKLNEIQRAFSTQGFLGIKGGVGAYLGGGYQGLIDYHKGKAKDLRMKGDIEGAEREEATVTSMTKMQNTAEQVTKVFQDLASGADLLGNMFKALGDSGTAAFFGDAAGVLGGVAGGAQALSGLGPWGMAAGAVIGGVTSIAQMHDKANQRIIEALQQDVKALEANTEMLQMVRKRTLGYDTGENRRMLGEMYSQYNYEIAHFGTMNSKYGAAGRAMAEFYGTGGNGYGQELRNLKQQREDYIDMYNAEYGKKDSSAEALEEYKQKIAELDDEILHFTQDLANELWGIDFKGWAEQISDAMWTAFENGEDAAEAWHDTVQDIISDVAKRMWNLSLIEPLFSKMQDDLFGTYNEETMQREGGKFVYDSNGNIDMEASMEGVLGVLGKYLGENGEIQKAALAGEEFFKWVEKVTGIDLTKEDKSSSSSSSKVIQGGFTENETSLLLSYVNTMRADLSINREMIAQYFPMFYQAITAGHQSLQNIEGHTLAIMRSNESIRGSVSDLRDDIRGLRNENWKVSVK